jgi:hypothetical protein
MEKTLTKPSPQRCADSPSILESLISEWVAKLAINAGASLDSKTQAVYTALWIEGLGDLSPDVLRAAFLKTLRECAYWPVKVADIRKHVISADTTLSSLEAENAWQKALSIAQDFGCDYSIASAREIDDPALEAALSAAGGCRLLATCPDKELPWAKKIFLEVYAKHKALPEVAQLCSRKDSPAFGEAKKILATLALGLLLGIAAFAIPAHAQVVPQIQGAGAPSNPCANGGQQYVDQTNHVLYGCPNSGGNWVNLGLGNLTGGGGGSGGMHMATTAKQLKA